MQTKSQKFFLKCLVFSDIKFPVRMICFMQCFTQEGPGHGSYETLPQELAGVPPHFCSATHSGDWMLADMKN